MRKHLSVENVFIRQNLMSVECRRQIQTSKVDPRTERIKYL